MPYIDSLDIANRALYHLGLPKIQSVTENSIRNSTMSDLYDRVRRAELRRNCWRFATRRCAIRPLTTTSMLLSARPWDGTITYVPGSMVTDANGLIWASGLAENLNNIPGVSSAWEPYFGPLAVDVWTNPAIPQSTVTSPVSSAYFAGELAYMTGPNAGQFVIFRSRVNSNTEQPNVPDLYNPATQYGLDALVVDGSNNLWRSIIAVNLGNTPAVPPAFWQFSSVYGQNVTVTGPDGLIYNSNVSNNSGNNPAIDNGIHWGPTGVIAAWQPANGEFGVMQPAATWLPVFGAATNINFTYPIGTGPQNNDLTRNAYRLPAGFLRRAPDDPKAGSTSYLGAPSGNQYDDWNLEGNFLVTREGSPLIIRFVADIAKVTDFDDMFCEGLAARLAMDACEKLTQSTEKLRNLSQLYKTYMTEARTVNGIETGATQPSEDDWVACRL